MGLKGHGSKFGGKMEQAVAALMTQPNIDTAARSVGISPNTLLNWMKVSEFDAAYRAAKRAAYGQAIARLQQAMPLAVQTMLRVMIDPATPASVKVRAAEVITNHSHKGIEIEDVEARVAALEAATGDQDKR
jgi:translation initiation factor 2 alpha subunit (eIF-2alpha)